MSRSLLRINGRIVSLWGPILIMMGLIFYSSSMPYAKQDIRPQIAAAVNPVVVKHFFSHVDFSYQKEKVSIQALGPAGFIEFFIRKGGHFTVYFLLTFLTSRALLGSNFSYRRAFIWSTLFAFVYAASDEFHQSFTAQRTPLVVDIILDTISGAIGAFVYCSICRTSIRRIQKN